LVDGLKTANLRDALPDSFRNSAQVRYELKKLIIRGIVQKKKDKSFYTVTQHGWKCLPAIALAILHCELIFERTLRSHALL